ncbi:hypothetical protein [Actinoplanes sp. NPDC049316]|uniref:hypothetical protein n=1 Tax=Actinoplanes sp. NPDC049316 TaxID=3154727 RepID=UPI003448FEB0
MIIDVDISPKALRETLCIAQARIGNSGLDEHRQASDIAHLQALIDECDRHRPLGPNGKHADLHTPTCGCEDVPACRRCGSPRWVPVSLDQGFTRRRQCVPCGLIWPGVIKDETTSAPNPPEAHRGLTDHLSQLKAMSPDQLRADIRRWQDEIKTWRTRAGLTDDHPNISRRLARIRIAQRLLDDGGACPPEGCPTGFCVGADDCQREYDSDGDPIYPDQDDADSGSNSESGR